MKPVPVDHAQKLAFEIRRLSRQLTGEGVDAPRGPLADSLATSFGLSAFEVDLALTVLAAEVDAEFRALLLGALPRADQGGELGILAALAPTLEQRLANLHAIGPSCAVVRHRLVHRNDDSTLRVSRRFRAVALGQPLLADLPGFATLRRGGGHVHAWGPDARAVARLAKGGASLCVVTGPLGSGKSTWALATATRIAPEALVLDIGAAAVAERRVVAEVRELIDDAALARVPVILDNISGQAARGARLATTLVDVFESSAAAMFVIVTDPAEVDERVLGRATARVTIGAPPPDVRLALWRDHAVGADEELARLAADLVLGPRQIQAAARQVAAGLATLGEAATGQLTSAHPLTVPDPTNCRLDGLVLAQETRDELEEIVGAIRARAGVLVDVPGSRGRGISALFDGESGTGKTLACEAIATEVGLPLMRVNVSSLVDKYIGETEKNLSRVFEQAKAHGGILFFDEADALFGTRTGVTKSQDRYANLETNLLLQLMEEHSGIVLLTTNLKQNIDPAFMRRIMFKVNFADPEPEQRQRLWERHVPERLRGTIDFAKLASAFELAGGSIRSAALRAAYRSSTTGNRISTNDLAECAKIEVSNIGRVAAWR